MSDDAPPAELIAEPTEAQFTIRALFVAMAVVAVLAAIAGTIVRHVEPDTRVRLLAAWGIWLLASIVWISYAAHQRRAAEKLAGRAMLRLPMFDEHVPEAGITRRRGNGASLVFLTLIMLAVFSSSAAQPVPTRSVSSELLQFVPLGIMCVFFTSRLATSFWWRKNVRFGEFGVLWDRRVLLWDHIVRCDFGDSPPNCLQLGGIDQNDVDMNLRVIVPPASRDALDAILKSNFVANPAVEIKIPVNHLARMPLSLAVRDRRFLNYIGLFLAVALCSIFIGTFAFFTGIDEFDQSAYLGFIGGGLGLALIRAHFRLRHAMPIGPPIVRLKKSRRWMAAFAAAVTAWGARWIGLKFGVASAPVAYVSGLAFGGLVNVVIHCVTRPPIDLREKGIYRFGSSFWPWEQVRLVTWEPDRGKLVLERGWSQLAAKVLPDQRDAVSRVLLEKLGDRSVQ